MDFLLVFLILILVVCAFMTYLCSRGGKSKLYCRFFNNEEWRGWETVIENFDTIEFEEHIVHEESPKIECYVFKLPGFGNNCRMNYWVKTNIVSVHGYPDPDCLCGFDQYHQKVVKDLLCEKFDFMKDVIMVR